MTIWSYDEELIGGGRMGPSELGSFYSTARTTRECKFCGVALEILRETLATAAPDGYSDFLHDRGIGHAHAPGKSDLLHGEGTDLKHTGPDELFEETLRVCPSCGWWIAFREMIAKVPEYLEVRAYGGVGALKLLDLTDVSTPIEEVRRSLSARYDERFDLAPKLFEETVASVFRDLGYRARVTGRSGDDGIDVILDGPGDQLIGVQVKRYRNSINVSQIRELIGALVVNKITKGIFVTTSTFQSGAERTAALAREEGRAIELVDAARFLEALHIAQRAAFTRDSGAHAPKPLQLLHERRGRTGAPFL